MKTKFFLVGSLAFSILLSWALARGNAIYELQSFSIQPKNVSFFPRIQKGGLQWKFTDVALPEYPGEGIILIGWDATSKTVLVERGEVSNESN